MSLKYLYRKESACGIEPRMPKSPVVVSAQSRPPRLRGGTTKSSYQEQPTRESQEVGSITFRVVSPLPFPLRKGGQGVVLSSPLERGPRGVFPAPQIFNYQ